MPLEAQALVPVPVVPGMAGVTCHVATWYWAAQEAQALGLCAVKTPAVTIGNIAFMNPNAQIAMLALPVAGAWDFATVPTLPPVGSVLLWRAAPTHSAVVTGLDRISGYNQSGWFPALASLGPVLQSGHTSPPLRSLAANLRRVQVILAATIIARAAALNL